MSHPSVEVHLRIVVRDPPAGPGTRFGVQDKTGGILPAVETSDDSATFEVEIKAAVQPGRSEPTFYGACAHGPPTARFVYVSHGTGVQPDWIKRIKVPLSSITWSLIVSARSGVLATEVDGRSSGSVRCVWRPNVSA